MMDGSLLVKLHYAFRSVINLGLGIKIGCAVYLLVLQFLDVV